MKTSITFLFVGIIAGIQSQAQTTFGLTAGSTYSNIKSKFGNESISGDYKFGFTAGVFADMLISKSISFQPAINFTQKGAKYKDEFGNETITLNYMEVPLNFVYSFQPGKGFFVGAGPSLAFGISGTDKYEMNGQKHTDKIHFGTNPEDDINSFEFAANFMAGFRTASGFIISGGYNAGLSNLANDDGSGNSATAHNNYFTLKIGWAFNTHK